MNIWQVPRTTSAPPHGEAQSPAPLVYTSGTTGRPRAAVHTQANLPANMRIAAQVQQLSGQDKVLTVLPLFHVGGLCIQTLPALYAGAAVTLHARFGADAHTPGAGDHEGAGRASELPAGRPVLPACGNRVRGCRMTNCASTWPAGWRA